MNIDWNEALSDAEDSPRGLLSELLTRADDITDMVIVFVTPTENGGEQTNTWQATRHQAMTIAMLEYAKWHQLHRMYEGRET